VEYLVTFYAIGTNVKKLEVLSERQVFKLIQSQYSIEENHREKFVIEKIGETLLDLS